jgi:thymidylate synthase ThyX
MHFMQLRLSHGAQAEIRVYAKALLQLALPHFPITLQAWSKKNLPDQVWQDELKIWIEQLGD